MFTGDNRRPFKLGLDAGHGGSDPGAVYDNVQEKNLTLQIVKDLFHVATYFQLNIKTYFTRLKSKNLSLKDRGEILNSLDLDLVLSIHCNAAENALAKGALAFIYPDNQESYLIAHRLLNNCPWWLKSERTGPIKTSSKGWTKRAHNVVKSFKANTVLFEMGFLSNNDDREYLTSSRGRYALCSTILQTIGDYAHEREQSSHP
jgi:N-acetylmuramoyl-L-alanine amidase